MESQKPTFNQINDQISSGHNKMTVLVERSGDKISIGDYTGKMLGNDQYVVNVTTRDGSVGYRTVSAEDLSDAKQVELAEALAATRVESHLQYEVLDDTLKRPIKALGQDALVASGIEQPESEAVQLDKILDKAPVLRQFEQKLKSIASMRRREESAGYRHGMNQFDSSERMIDDLVKLANLVEKPKTLSENRREVIYRYIDKI